MDRKTITIDGSEGEGGGQVLRSALALSLITRRPITLTKIRGRRKKPGLMRQHLTAVRAAAAIGDAAVEGAAIGSQELRFAPKSIRHGEHRFAVGTAGSATLVLQTVLWPLLVAPGRSRLRLEGGTHNPLAPPFDFIERVLCPILASMGARIGVKLLRHGFFPAGGGCFEVEIEGGAALRPLTLEARGQPGRRRARALVANLSREIGERELAVVHERLGWGGEEMAVEMVESNGPGNALLLEVESEHARELVSAFGEPGVRSEEVARAAVDEAREYLGSDVPVGRHLADQLLIPFALAGGGSFRTLRPTLHTTTNAALCGRFLEHEIVIEREEGGAARVAVVRGT